MIKTSSPRTLVPHPRPRPPQRRLPQALPVPPHARARSSGGPRPAVRRVAVRRLLAAGGWQWWGQRGQCWGRGSVCARGGGGVSVVVSVCQCVSVSVSVSVCQCPRVSVSVSVSPCQCQCQYQSQYQCQYQSQCQCQCQCRYSCLCVGMKNSSGLATAQCTETRRPGCAVSSSLPQLPQYCSDRAHF
jgi:hypothetical protein